MKTSRTVTEIDVELRAISDRLNSSQDAEERSRLKTCLDALLDERLEAREEGT